MSKSDSDASRKERNKTIRWIFMIVPITMLVSGAISFVSDRIMEDSSIIVAFIILLLIVFIGVLADTIGLSVTSADEKPFHSMAARKVPGSLESIRLLRNADRVSSICNDVIGDICGVVSGSASATIAAQVLHNFSFTWPQMISLLMSALVAGLTVGGKAMGKSFALHSSTQVVSFVGKCIFYLRHIPNVLKKDKR